MPFNTRTSVSSRMLLRLRTLLSQRTPTRLQRFISLCTIMFLTLSVAFTQDIAEEDIHDEAETTKQHSQIFDSDFQKELIIVQGEAYLNLDPQTSSYSSEAQILNGLYEGLFSYDPLTLEPTPALATSYKISRDKKKWTFTIRDGAKFSNGDPITAQSVYDSWVSLIDPKKDAPFASLLDCIEGVQAYRIGSGSQKAIGIQVKDDKTLIVKLSHPTDYFAKILSHHAFSIIHADKTVQSGPFIIAKEREREIVLEKNNYYWDAENVALPSIRFILSDDSDENTHRFNMGHIHWLTDSFNTRKLIQPKSLILSTQFGTEYYFFKRHEDSVWNNPTVRKALLLALPWEQLRQNYYIPANTLLARLHGYPEIYGIEETDIDDARTLLDSLNIPADKKQITVLIPDTEYHREQILPFIENWEKIGITTNVQLTPNSSYYNSIPQSDADLFTYTWIGDFADPMAFLELFKKGSSLNESLWSGERYENLLDEATQINDPKKRYEKLAEAEQELLDNFVIIPLSHPVSANILDKAEIGGWYENALNLHPLKNLYFKKREPIKNLLIAGHR